MLYHIVAISWCLQNDFGKAQSYNIYSTSLTTIVQPRSSINTWCGTWIRRKQHMTRWQRHFLRPWTASVERPEVVLDLGRTSQAGRRTNTWKIRRQRIRKRSIRSVRRHHRPLHPRDHHHHQQHHRRILARAPRLLSWDRSNALN